MKVEWSSENFLKEYEMQHQIVLVNVVAFQLYYTSLFQYNNRGLFSRYI